MIGIERMILNMSAEFVRAKNFIEIEIVEEPDIIRHGSEQISLVYRNNNIVKVHFYQLIIESE